MRAISTLLLILLSSGLARAQNLLWEKTYGGSSFDNNPRIKKTAGGYLICGNTQSGNGNVTGFHGNIDTWLVKADTQGNMLWQKALGGPGSNQSLKFNSTSDGGAIICGATDDFQITPGQPNFIRGLFDASLMKVDSAGNLQWHKEYGGSDMDYFFDVCETADHGFLAVGYTKSVNYDVGAAIGNADIWVVKTNGSGNIEWEKSLGGTDVDVAYTLLMTADGGAIISGTTWSSDVDVTQGYGGSDVWVVKLSDTGTIEWQQTYGGSGDDLPHDMKTTADGGYIVLSESNSTNGHVGNTKGFHDVWLLKLSGTGQVQWSKTYGGSKEDAGFTVLETHDTTGYIISGLTYSINGDVTNNHDSTSGDVWIIRTSKSGNIGWQRCYGGLGNDMGYGIIQLNDTSFMFTGSTTSDSLDVSSNHGNQDYWIAAINSGAITGVHNVINELADVHIYPTTTQGSIKVDVPEKYKECTLTIYTDYGIRITSSRLSAAHSILDLSGFPGGLYFAEVKNRDGRFVQRVIITN